VRHGGYAVDFGKARDDQDPQFGATGMESPRKVRTRHARHEVIGHDKVDTGTAFDQVERSSADAASRDKMLDHVTLYWLTNTRISSSRPDELAEQC